MQGHPLDEGFAPAWACEWGRDQYGVFAGFAVGQVVQRMRWIASGSFKMGSPHTEAGRFDDEGPQHLVTLTRGFWLADTPCTQALWTAVMGANPSQFQDPERPVEQVSWEDCAEFLRRLRGCGDGRGLRLPTEAEWEYACRAGTQTATWAGNLTLSGHEVRAPELDAIAWYVGNSREGFDLDGGVGTRKVRTRQPNPRGLYDMLGNVWEWCSHWHGSYDEAPSIDPRGPESGTYRVLRGGSWLDQAMGVRAAARLWRDPGDRYSLCGFRLAQGHPT